MNDAVEVKEGHKKELVGLVGLVSSDVEQKENKNQENKFWRRKRDSVEKLMFKIFINSQ